MHIHEVNNKFLKTSFLKIKRLSELFMAKTVIC